MRFIAKLTVDNVQLVETLYDHKDGFNPSHSATKAKDQMLKDFDQRFGAQGVNRDAVTTIATLFEVFVSSSLDANGHYVGDPITNKTISYRDEQGRQVRYQFTSMSEAHVAKVNKDIDDQVNAALEKSGIKIR